jgi:hypothetical protein
MRVNEIDTLLTMERSGVHDALEYFLAEDARDRIRIERLSEDTKLDQVNFIIRRMLDSIRIKQDALDTRDIDDSRGDLHKVRDHASVHEALKQIRVIANGPHPVDDLLELEGYILKHSEAFRMAYDKENKIGVWFYEAAVLDLYYGTMLVIAQGIRTVKVATGIRLEADLSANIGASYAMQSVRGKCKLFRESKVTQALNASGAILQEWGLGSVMAGISSMNTAANSAYTGVVAAMTTPLGMVATGVVVTLLVVFSIRYTIMQFYNMRRYIAGEFKIVANFLELHAATVGNQATAARQEALARSLNSMADAISIKNTTAEGTTKADIKREIVPELKQSGIPTPPELHGDSAVALV